MGRFIKLPGVQSALQSVEVLDPILPAQGALYLTETNHPVEPWEGAFTSVGAPAGISVLGYAPNIAKAQTLALLGSSGDNQAINQNWNDSSFGGADFGKAERSVKGGLHVIFTERVDTAISGGKGVWADIPQVIENYLWSNAVLDHPIYASMWTRTTRVPLAGGQMNWLGSFGQSVSITGKFLYGFNANTVLPTSGGMVATNDGRYGDPVTAGASRRRSIAQRRPTGVTFSSGAPEGYLINVGTSGTANSYLTAKNRSGSHVFYRTYIEDLTVSGRTYAEVEAIDAAMFAQAFGPGGRYANDATPTAPSTIA